MFSRFLRFLAPFFIALAIPFSVFAVNLGATDLKNAGEGAGIATGDTEGSLPALIGSVVNSILSVLGLLLFLIFLYAGLLWMTAQGDPKKVQKAKDIMGNSVIGLALTLSAYAIVVFVSIYIPGGDLIWGSGDFLTTAGINSSNSVFDIIGSLLQVALGFLGLVLFLIFLYAGWLWMTAQGDPKQVEKAKTMMGNAVIGLVLILSSYAIVAMLSTFFLADVNGGTIWGETTSVADAAGLSTTQNVWGIIGSILNVLLGILGVVLFLIFLYSGWLWMTAQGDTKQVDKAKVMMRNAVVGLVIILLSRAFAEFIIDYLTGANSIF